jgi:hypothetical protein
MIYGLKQDFVRRQAVGDRARQASYEKSIGNYRKAKMSFPLNNKEPR